MTRSEERVIALATSGKPVKEAQTHHDGDDCPVITPHIARYEDSAVCAKTGENEGEGSESERDTHQGSIFIYLPARGRRSKIHWRTRSSSTIKAEVEARKIK